MGPSFTLSRTMSTKFYCEITAHIQGLPPIVIPYYMHHEPKTLRKVILFCQNYTADTPTARKVQPIHVFNYGADEEDPEPPTCVCIDV